MDFREGFINYKRGIVLRILRNTARAALKDLCEKKSFQGFTGQTQTSYTCGVYENGKLLEIIHESDFTNPPVAKKVQKGKTVYLKNPYEGRPRKVTGQVKVNNRSGKDTADDFLKSFKAPVKGYAIVATTGTEYSEYLENVKKLNVMTSTWVRIGDIFNAQG